ncbi:uncharacterized protein LOC110410302 [Herrania umbratica]|uniref:Uncharacterized protein LOC110410302 n=1 Tax=Herrania umbratica TaxID=108875 RepID=A0A6J0ZLD4_9ROSI|nr:uncharacterized protein LOC110410302 [Herrania umbratica]
MATLGSVIPMVLIGEALTKDYRAVVQMGKETGLGWNHKTGTIEADATWWEAKIKVNPKYARFRYQGLEHADELKFIFRDTIATNQNAWTPAMGVPIEDNVRSTNLTSLQDSVEFDAEEFNCDEEDGSIVSTQIKRKKMVLEEMGKKMAKGKAKIGTAASLQRTLERLCEVAESHNATKSAEISMSSQATGQYGKYYVVDTGYPNMKGYLAFYKSERSHIPDFRGCSQPEGVEETINHAHSSLRNVIERTIGV